MIDDNEVLEYAERFGVPADQIKHDHLVSHILAALAAEEPAELVFFGGTALCRTWLPELRLSEDIDLLVDSTDLSKRLRHSISVGLRREFPNTEWLNAGSKHDVETWNLVAGDLTVKVQFAPWRFRWRHTIETATTKVQLRYSDLPESVRLTVPTSTGFAAMKLLAWFDRAAPRDIYDLAALAEADMIDAPALRSVQTIAGYTPKAAMITNVAMRRVRTDWGTELGHQIGNPKSLDECIELVRDALKAIQ